MADNQSEPSAAAAAEDPPAFMGGDRVEHPATGPATVAGRKGARAHLGPNGELKVRPDAKHHSGKPIVEVMARRCVAIEQKKGK